MGFGVEMCWILLFFFGGFVVFFFYFVFKKIRGLVEVFVLFIKFLLCYLLMSRFEKSCSYCGVFIFCFILGRRVVSFCRCIFRVLFFGVSWIRVKTRVREVRSRVFFVVFVFWLGGLRLRMGVLLGWYWRSKFFFCLNF